MDDRHFDSLARVLGRAPSRRAALQGALGAAAGALGVVGIASDAEGKKSKKKKQRRRKRQRQRKKRECNSKGKICETPLNPCEEAVCRKHKCQTEVKPDGTECGANQACENGQCVSTCRATGDTCSAGNECCSEVCTCDGGKVGNPETGQCHGDEFVQTFADNVDGWYDWNDLANDGNGEWPGTTTTIKQVGDHAELSPGQAPAGDLTPMTLWGGYSSEFPAGGFDTELDIFLESATTDADTTFRWGSAINNSGCTFLQEAYFNAGTNADGSQFCVSIDGGGDPCAGETPVTIAAEDAGWHTFRHEFRRVGGNVRIALKLLRGNDVLAVWVVTGGGDLGGNRYGWFPNNDFDALQIRNSKRIPG